MAVALDIGIIADDLTGACDVAASFCRTCGSVNVSVANHFSQCMNSHLTVINTQSRLKTADECRALLKDVGLLVRDRSIIFKKIDAALRGSVGAELEGLSETLGQREIVIAPAIPSIGRTTRGGIQFDKGIPISETAYANDPVSPVKVAKISDIIKETGNITCRIYDAETDEDLSRIVKDGLRNENIIFVGSLGLADALADVIGEGKAEQKQKPQFKSRRILIVSGSQYDRTHRQILQAREHAIIRLFDVHPDEYHDPDLDTSSLKDIHDDEVVLIRLSSDAAQPKEVTPSKLLKWFLLKVHTLIFHMKPDAIGIIGGETLFSLFKSFNIHTLRVQGRISDVMPHGTIIDGHLAGCIFSSKGGSVGSDDAVIKMIRFFRGA